MYNAHCILIFRPHYLRIFENKGCIKILKSSSEDSNSLLILDHKYLHVSVYVIL